MITVITPTGGRQECFDRLEFYMSRQTVKPDQWIVIDDCLPRTECRMGQEVIYPSKLWQAGDMSLPANVLAGLEAAKGDVILIMEDDDYYAPDYIETMTARLNVLDMAGEGQAKYYNVKNYRFIQHANIKHASLCQTGFTRKVLDDVKAVTKKNIGEKYLDIRLWEIECKKSVFMLQRSICVGIKGQAGRAGIGYGHKDTMGEVDVQPWRKLKQWIGEDYLIYAKR